MNRPDLSTGQNVGEHSSQERAEVAAIAAKVAGLPSHRGHDPISESSAATRCRSKCTCVAIVLAWLATLGLVCIALLRVLYHDGSNILVLLNSFTTYVYLPAYGCLALAVWKRRRWLALASVSIIACHAYWLAPDFIRDSPYDVTPSITGPQAESRSVRIFYANVRMTNTEHSALLKEIEEADPDIIVLVEFSGPWYQAFRMSPLIAKYPYGGGFEAEYIVGANIFSRLPIKSETQDWIGKRGIESIDVPLGSQTLRLIALHAARPTNLEDYDYVEYWSRALPILKWAPHPVVVVGDFNATQHSLVYQQIKDGGLRSAHEDRGRGYATTWPNNYAWLPQIRIDQAFLSPEVECVGIAEGIGKGSDHRPLILDVELRRQH